MFGKTPKEFLADVPFSPYIGFMIEGPKAGECVWRPDGDGLGRPKVWVNSESGGGQWHDLPEETMVEGVVRLGGQKVTPQMVEQFYRQRGMMP